MMYMILHQIIYLNIEIISKGADNKVARFGNQRALYDLEMPTIFRIISHVFGNTHKRRF